MPAVVNTNHGRIQGESAEGISVWKGIPYAKPPIGERRFKPPAPLEPWEGVFEATVFGPVAPQINNKVMAFLGNETDYMDEDCLYLNVWSPAADDKRRPVMVWIHGGAFAAGAGSSKTYDGTSFAREGDVVVVTFNYRLGALGFLYLDEAGGQAYAGSGNCGIQDQVAALQWVQDNIENFGGDPNRVTVFGESAGAMSIGTLMAIPSAKGLFHQAILQSGAAGNIISPDAALRTTGRVLDALGITIGELEKLHTLPADKIVSASSALPPMSLVPVVDGTVVPTHPEQALADGSAKDIPVLIGTNKDEYRLFTFFDPRWNTEDEQEIESIFSSTFGQGWAAISKQLPPGAKLNQEMYDNLLTMSIFTYPAIRLAEKQVAQEAPVWMYRFDWKSPVAEGGLKACHALELPFVWNGISSPGAQKLTGTARECEELACVMHEAWIRFAHSGNPNIPGLPEWPAYELERRSVLAFNAESHVLQDPDSEQRKSWMEAAAHR